MKTSFKIGEKQKTLLFALLLVLVLVVATAAFLGWRKNANTLQPLDYTKAENWAYEGGESDKPADLFIVCPSISGGSADRLTIDVNDEKTRGKFTGALNMELGIYTDECTVYAPFYRQATLYTYAERGAVMDDALNDAYVDVSAAFAEYLKTADPTRPLVLAGFSQGSDMVVRLMKEYFGDAALQDRLVAAYVIGWRVTQEECDAYPQLKAATGPDDTGVIVSFNSEDESITDSLMVPAGTKTLAINPLNWKTDATPADAAQNLGACFTDYGGNITAEIPALCGAALDPVRGTLKVTGVTPADYPAGLAIFTDGIYHLYDYQFFYRNLQENVSTRVEAWQQQNALPAAA